MGWRPFKNRQTRDEWRDYFLQRQDGLCALCGHRFPREGDLNEQLAAAFAPTFDHVVPRSQGGRDERGNLQLAHSACNHAKGDGTKKRSAPGVPRALR